MDLEVIDRHALLFDDDTTSAFVNSSEALVPWIHDSSLFIDRYDVRHLLDRIPSRKLHACAASEDPSQSELDLERYLDLPALALISTPMAMVMVPARRHLRK